MIKSVKEAVCKRLSLLVFILIVMQPLLDVLSFFLGEMGSNALSTLLRFGLLAVVALLGFIVSGKKRLYIVFYAAAGVFWVLHMANCFRIGYQSMVQDAANFLRIVSFLVFTLSLITFFRQGRQVRRAILLGFGVNFGLFWLFTLLPWVLGMPQYTYDKLFVGMMGWFSIPNAQSTILVLTAPFAIYWAYHTRKYPLFLIMCLLCFSMMFVTGTKLTFYSIFIIAGAYAFLFALQQGKSCLRYSLPLLGMMVLVFVFRHQSPMDLREQMSAYSRDLYNQKVEQSLQKNGGDKEALEEAQKKAQSSTKDKEKDKDKKKQPVAERTMEQIHKGLFYVYTDSETYGDFFKDMNERFGVYRVMDAYRYSTSSGVLSDFRVMKSLFSQMVWEEKDFATRLLGYEYSEVVVGGTIYDLENDFPAIYYFFGYIGSALYMLVFVYIAFVVIRAFLLDVACGLKAAPFPREGDRKAKCLWGAKGFWQGFRQFLTVEMGAAGMSFLLAIIAAQISGYVLRRPNVTIYFAVSAAYLFHLCVDMRRESLSALRKAVLAKISLKRLLP